MAVQQIEEIKEPYFDPFTGEKMEETTLYISGEKLSNGQIIEVLTPKGWQQARITLGLFGWAFASTPLKPIGLIARTV